jgi:hypothetical protein
MRSELTKEEAQIYFPIPAGKDVDELYEERLFEYKQFFLSKVPLIRLVEPRLRKLTQMEAAFHVLSGKEEREEELFLNEDIVFGEDLEANFNAYQIKRNYFKQKIILANSGEYLTKVIQASVALHENYALSWPFVEVDLQEKIAFSTEQDPMVIVKAFKILKEEKIDLVLHLINPNLNTNVNNSVKNALEILKLEAKRLSLQLKNRR